jgi:hypothetical protein
MYRRLGTPAANLARTAERPRPTMSYTMVGVLMVGGLALYALLGVIVGRRLLHGKVVEGHNDVCVPIFLNAGVLFAVLLGFMVIAVWESYDAAKNNAATEAADLIPLYRATNALPQEAGDRMRELTRNYAEAVVKDEWPTQASTGQGSSKARKAIGDLFRAFGDGTINAQIKKDYPFICTALMNAINDVTAARNKRNIQANEETASIMWIVAIAGALLVIGMSFVLFMERPVPHMLLSTAMAALIGSLLFTCFVLAHPFRGPHAITAESFENALNVMDDVDRGN